MELTKKQLEGLKIALDRFAAGNKYTVISGYAGTGKSTLIKFIVSALKGLGIEDCDVAYCAYTGKAAEVLRQKGNPNASTLHKLLYTARPTKDGKFVFTPKSELEYSIIVVDEVSMVPMPMVEELLRHHCYVIFCGDPAQLPPVSSNEDNHLLDKPHVFLDEIMRQALDSEIINLSMNIRQDEKIDFFHGKEAIVMKEDDMTTGLLDWADIVLCGTNKKRQSINSQIRALKGYVEPLVEGERVICLRNNWEMTTPNGAALTNGCGGTLHDISEKTVYPPSFLHIPPYQVIVARFVSDEGEDFGTLFIDKKMLLEGTSTLSNIELYKLNNKKFRYLIPQQFAYGYCITVWKAQGSEWDKVLLIEEGHPYEKEQHRQFLYTGITRAAKQVVWAR